MNIRLLAAALATMLFTHLSAAQTLATVNGKDLTQAEFNIYAQNRTQGADVTPEQKAQILDEMIDLKLLASAAEKQSLQKKPDVAISLELQQSQLLAREMLRIYLEQNPVTDSDLKAAYEKANGTGTDTAPEYKARHILLATEADAITVIKELDNGGDFATLAQEKSTGPSASKGGDLGWFPAKAMVKPFSDAVAQLKKGGYSMAPVQTQFGYHVILLEDSRTQSFEQVKENYRNPATQLKIQGYIQGLRTAAKIEKPS